MADNYLEKQFDDYVARKARQERERKARLHRYLEQYRKRLKEQQDTAERED